MRLPWRRDAARDARLRLAIADVDRELAANLELTTMFDSTHHAVVLENAQFARHREVLAEEMPTTFAALADLYVRIPTAEAAMERRGPAASFSDADRAIVEGWEGDARVAQRTLRAGPVAEGSLIARAFARLFGRGTASRS